jgi:uncharacterized protein YlaN (UPF0358 family)
MIYKEYVYDDKTSPLGLSNNIWHFETKLKNIDITELNLFLLQLEKELLKKRPLNDGGTGLPNGVTSRYEYYNLLKQDHNEIRKLEDQIKLVLKTFLNFKKIYLEKIYILCWFNVLRKNEKINLHRHVAINDMHYSCVSGHISTTNNNTSTFYTDLSEKNQIEVRNESGKITLFPSYIPHYTNENLTDNERISIAFDIHFNSDHCSKEYLDAGILKEICMNC